LERLYICDRDIITIAKINCNETARFRYSALYNKYLLQVYNKVIINDEKNWFFMLGKNRLKN